ncbi:tau-cadinol synthase-like [Triticum dicoccoides]|uniref:tau-cadinol synthase-like n=1 Tax=Triticum dicoccoides TaxID=85692 RepID=UPI0018908DDE|nr:tau-cadinol synthase-like [Triticum dicoccoides]
MASGATAAPERRVCSFEPSVWGDFFIHHNPEPLQISEKCMRVKADKLKEDIHKLLKTSKGSVVEKMTLLDALQHLGIDHLFQEQINTVIDEIHKSEFNSDCLYEVALHFRLLREHGCWVSPDIFNQFQGKDGSFNMDTITSEPRGLLCLYNAAYLAIHGEPELDNAICFARQHLESMRGGLKYPLSEQVKRNLKIPLPRTLNRIDAPYYIAEYKHDQACNPSVLELAKLDFNLLQCLHQRELKAFCRWGNDLYEDVGLSYSRNRIVECYFWSYTVHYEQHYGHARLILAKLFALSSLLDDTFDMHATLEEGQKLNEAIQKWDDSAITLLPEYLKRYYVKLMKTFSEFENELKQDRKYRIVHCRKAFQTLCKHYQQESEWFHSSHIPSFEDHVKCSVISAGTPSLVIGSLVGMGDEATDEAFKWALAYPDIVKACGKVTRFMDDLAAFKHGKNKLDVASSLESYINQHHVTSEVAIAVLEIFVEEAWKTTNRARLDDRRALLPFVNRVANLTKSMTMLFRDKGDLYTFSRGNKDRIQGRPVHIR